MTAHTPPSHVWFVTGASRGLGRAVTEAALERGDRVVGAARDVTPLDGLAERYEDRLLALPLDVSDRAAVFSAVRRAVDAFGCPDVVLNNAGRFLLGMVEETTEQQAREHLDVNFFGALWVVQAVLPHLRARGSGRIIQVTTTAPFGGFASVGLYGAGKAALDSVGEALAMEVEPFGIRVTMVQPRGYATELFTRGATLTKEKAEYAPLRARLTEMWSGVEDADSAKAAPVLLALADMADPPRRLVLGGAANAQVRQILLLRAEGYARTGALSARAD
ncbi:SDR family NAD(P)-dependent oxidoreductase [Thermobifida cellulosilytica]|uniref:Short-chain dehydrogenase n=1 Tax=Thermobifida cellulosilytica TB100 TaxID=665004 RepID=A0A147KHM9_THECS|nr:SDR family NAD(P)-dependent oxidoreductase [Thermobifida cellulosilytica]KUP96798.1 short-chain dehydrogenase [Thermobifida cellulosilytica TB100]